MAPRPRPPCPWKPWPPPTSRGRGLLCPWCFPRRHAPGTEVKWAADRKRVHPMFFPQARALPPDAQSRKRRCRGGVDPRAPRSDRTAGRRAPRGRRKHVEKLPSPGPARGGGGARALARRLPRRESLNSAARRSRRGRAFLRAHSAAGAHRLGWHPWVDERNERTAVRAATIAASSWRGCCRRGSPPPSRPYSFSGSRPHRRPHERWTVGWMPPASRIATRLAALIVGEFSTQSWSFLAVDPRGRSRARRARGASRIVPARWRRCPSDRVQNSRPSLDSGRRSAPFVANARSQCRDAAGLTDRANSRVGGVVTADLALSSWPPVRRRGRAAARERHERRDAAGPTDRGPGWRPRRLLARFPNELSRSSVSLKCRAVRHERLAVRYPFEMLGFGMSLLRCAMRGSSIEGQKMQ